MLQFFLKNKRYLFLICLFITALTLFARNIDGRKKNTLIDRFVLALFTPPLKITTFGIHAVSRLWDDYVFLVDLQQENRALREKIERLALDNQRLLEQKSENDRFREILAFKKKFEYKMVAAEIIGRDPSSWFKTIIVDKGGSDGVEKDSGVITPDGVVGKVIEVTGGSAKVLLITDVNSSVDALIKRSRARGIVVGYNESSCILSYVLKTEDIAPGDMLSTTGQNSIYPKGVQIGSIKNIRKDKSGFFQFVEVCPSVDFSKLHEVLIVLKEKTA